MAGPLAGDPENGFGELDFQAARAGPCKLGLGT